MRSTVAVLLVVCDTLWPLGTLGGLWPRPPGGGGGVLVGVVGFRSGVVVCSGYSVLMRTLQCSMGESVPNLHIVNQKYSCTST